MNKIKRIIALLLVFTTLVYSFPLIADKASAATDTENTVSGKCGANATWQLNFATGLLIISGYGKIESAPWREYGTNIISTANIGNGITNICDSAFFNCENLKKVIIADSVQEIGAEAFAFCASLSFVMIPHGVTEIKAGTFFCCMELNNVILPDTVRTICEGAFCYCDELRIDLPDSVSKIEGGAFSPLMEDMIRNTTVTIRNPRCIIDEENGNYMTLYSCDIYGYEGSTAQAYAEKYKSSHFFSMGAAPFQPKLDKVELGPFDIKGANLEVAGYEFPLIDLEASINLGFGNLKFVNDSNSKTARILIGFDEDASANIQGSDKSPTYWSDSYQEVKSLYQNLTDKKVDTPRLWNRFSALRGKLKTLKASMVVDVSASLAGYIEYNYQDNQFEGGLLVSFSAGTTLRNYYGPVYLALSIEVGADGALYLTYDGEKVVPSITASPYFELGVIAGIGTKGTYAQVGAYGTLSTNIDSRDEEQPLTVNAGISARWVGFLCGRQLFNGQKDFPSAQLYPITTKREVYDLTPGIDVSEIESYHELLDSSSTISRNYLDKGSQKKNSPNPLTFVKRDLYPVSEPNLVSFDDGSLLLVWIDDTGVKSDENMRSLLYSYFNGTAWSEPATLFENGTNSDMPSIYSDGRYAYIVCQKASKEFEEDYVLSESLAYYDLYATVFDSSAQTFSEQICINSSENSTFEFAANIFGADGSFTVLWLENSDNNVYQMSGTNMIKVAKYDKNLTCISEIQLASTENIFTDFAIGSIGAYYSVQEDGVNNLYDEAGTLKCGNIRDFSIENGKIYYLSEDYLVVDDAETINSYSGFSGVDNFEIAANDNNCIIYTQRINPDLSQTLYFSKLDADTGWTPFEVYSRTDCYIRNYSPTLLADGSSYIAFNYISINNDSVNEESVLSVETSSEAVDISINYVDFASDDILDETVTFEYEIQNNSSRTLSGYTLSIQDENLSILREETINCELEAFSSQKFAFNCTFQRDMLGESLKFTILPTELYDHNMKNNSVETVIVCMHMYPDNWLAVKEASCTEEGLEEKACTVGV